MKKNKINLKKLVLLAFFVAIGLVISPFLRVYGFAPTQHLVNVVCSVFLGPYYSLVCAFTIGILRMMLLGVSPLALSGAVFGAFLSGFFYKKSKGKLLAACFGEVFGTGIIGSLISFPLMKFVLGDSRIALFTFTPSFILASLLGSSMAFIFLKTLEKNKSLQKMKDKLYE